MVGENCIVLELRGPGASDAYGKVADETDGSLIWSGRAPATLRSERKQKKEQTPLMHAVAGQRSTRIEVDVVYIRREAGVPFDAITVGEQLKGTTVLIQDNRGKTLAPARRRVVSITNSAAGLSVDAVQLELADERTA